MVNAFYFGEDAYIMAHYADLQFDPETVTFGPVPAVITVEIKRGQLFQYYRLKEDPVLVKICLAGGEPAACDIQDRVLG